MAPLWVCGVWLCSLQPQQVPHPGCAWSLGWGGFSRAHPKTSFILRQMAKPTPAQVPSYPGHEGQGLSSAFLIACVWSACPRALPCRSDFTCPEVLGCGLCHHPHYQ